MPHQDILDMANAISTKQDFLLFLTRLGESISNSPDDWENTNLPAYMEGMRGYVRDNGEETISWRALAEILLAARIYD